MSKPILGKTPDPKPDALFDRVAVILDEARGNVVRAVNTQMVLAYWLIGREIVEALQSGEERAAYGKQVLSDLSKRLAQRYGEGFSVPNLQNFRKFYLAYSARLDAAAPIQYPPGTKSGKGRIQYPAGRELMRSQQSSSERGVLPQGFSPQLTWSHYRALMRVDNAAARDFYEREAIECGGSKVQLEHQFKIPGDNPTIGLLLCSDKTEAVAKYSILNESRQIFASKYMLCLPTEDQLRLEVVRERHLIESALEDRADG